MPEILIYVQSLFRFGHIMSAAVHVDPNMMQMTRLVEDEEELDLFCMNYGLAPRTVPPGVGVVVGRRRGRAPRNPVYGLWRDFNFNPAKPQCTGTVTKHRVEFKNGGRNQMRCGTCTLMKSELNHGPRVCLFARIDALGRPCS